MVLETQLRVGHLAGNRESTETLGSTLGIGNNKNQTRISHFMPKTVVG